MLSVKCILTGWMMNSGIYRITNKLNNKRYIGSAIDLAARWRTHRFRLSNNNHHSIKLQRSWSKHGEDTFTFEVLEEVIKPSNITKKEWRSLILSREQYYLDILCLLDKGIYQKDIAKQFGVTQSTISWIHNRKFLEV